MKVELRAIIFEKGGIGNCQSRFTLKLSIKADSEIFYYLFISNKFLSLKILSIQMYNPFNEQPTHIPNSTSTFRNNYVPKFSRRNKISDQR